MCLSNVQAIVCTFHWWLKMGRLGWDFYVRLSRVQLKQPMLIILKSPIIGNCIKNHLLWWFSSIFLEVDILVRFDCVLGIWQALGVDWNLSIDTTLRKNDVKLLIDLPSLCRYVSANVLIQYCFVCLCRQVGFLVGICLPCYELLAEIIPETHPMVDGAK